MNILKCIVISILVLNMIGCATLFHGSTDDVMIMAPQNAKVTVDGMPAMPGVNRLDSRKPHAVAITDEKGQQRFCGQVNSNMSVGYMIFELLFWFPGLIVDAITGDWDMLSPQTVACQ